VLAPFDGQVVYTGTFLAYGNLVILRHRDDFHTLIAGVDKIYANPGQTLLEGEPIGAMGGAQSGNRVYLELREHNQPIDPTSWLKG
jgi:murein hydrolase activator